MTTKLDYGITIGATVYDAYWVSAEINESFSSPATFRCVVNGSGTSDFAIITVGADFKLYEYDAAGSGTRRFLGVINSVKRLGFNQIQLSGYDYGGKLMNNSVALASIASIKTFESDVTDTLDTIVGKLCSTNLDGSAPWIVTKGTIDGGSTVIGKFKIPIISRWEALLMLARRAGKEIYITPTTGALNMVTLRGNSSSVKTYNLTGASTNAYSGSHEFTNNNIYNDIIGEGLTDLTTRFQDLSTTFTKTAFTDTVLTSPFVWTAGSVPSTMYVASTDGFPSSGTIILRACLGGGALVSMLQTDCAFTFTGKTATTLTGVAAGTNCYTAGSALSGTIVNLQSVIKVDDNSSFPSSGTIVIGEEMIAYSAKSDSSTFTVSSSADNVRNVTVTTTVDGDQTAVATTITVLDASSFPSSGVLKIGTTNFETEYVSYTGKTGTTFTGCSRGYNKTKPAALGTGSVVVLYFKAVAHPRGVLVYKYVTSADANSSIGLKGRHTLTLRLERASNIFDVEAQTSRYLELHKWGDQNAEITVPTYFDYGAVMLGDKITMNDTTLSWSSYAVRVIEKTLTIDRSSGSYDLHYVVATYSDVPAEGNASKDVQDFIISMTGAKEGTVSAAGTDADIDYGTPLATSGGINSLFKVPSGTAAFTNENTNGYVFSNNFWANASQGTCFQTPVNLYGVAIDTSGNLYLPSAIYFNYSGTDYAALQAVSSTSLMSYLNIVPNANTLNIGSSASSPTYRWGTYYGINLNITGTVSANGGVGSAGQILTSNGASPAYWADAPSSGGYWTESGSTLYPTDNRWVLPKTDDNGEGVGSSSKRWSYGYFYATFVDEIWMPSTGTAHKIFYYKDTDEFYAGTAGNPQTVNWYGNVCPAADNTYYCGTSSLRWYSVYGVQLMGEQLDLKVPSSASYINAFSAASATAVTCNAGHFYTLTAETYDIGTNSNRWQTLWIKNIGSNGTRTDYGYFTRLYCSTQTASNYITGSAFCEMGLLSEKQREGIMNGEPCQTDFKHGDVLVWKNGELTTSYKKGDKLVQAVSSTEGQPIVMGAEPIKVIGAVHEGDYLVSAEDGSAISSSDNVFGTVIAQALETNEAPEPKLIKAMIRKM